MCTTKNSEENRDGIEDSPSSDCGCGTISDYFMKKGDLLQVLLALFLVHFFTVVYLSSRTKRIQTGLKISTSEERKKTEMHYNDRSKSRRLSAGFRRFHLAGRFHLSYRYGMESDSDSI